MATPRSKKPRALTLTQQAKLKATQARAAAIFGDVPVFDVPRVRPDALRAAVLGMITRVWNAQPHVMPLKPGALTIQYVGKSAFTSHTWAFASSGPGAARMLVAAGAVNLPALPETSISRTQANEYLGYAIHEVCGHWLYTCDNAWRHWAAIFVNEAPLFRAACPNVRGDYARNVFNALEDARIEADLIDAATVRGAAACLRATLAGIMDAARENVDPRDLGDFPFVLAFGLRAHAAAGDMVDALPTALRAIYDYAATELLRIRALRWQDRTDATGQLALRVCEKISEIAPPLPTKKPAGDQPGDTVNPDQPGQPCEDGDEGDEGEGDQPGEGEPGEGEPGEGEPGEGEPGEGEPGEGEPGDQPTGSADAPAPVRPPLPGAPGQGDQPGDQPGPQDDDDAVIGDAASKGRDAGITLHGDVDDYSGAVLPAIVRHYPVMDTQTREALARRARVAALGAFAVLKNSMRRLLERTDNDSQEGGKRAGRINASALHRVATGADTVFRRRTCRDGVRSAVSVCVDGSGSMSYTMRQAMDAALVLAEVSASAGARVEITVFQDDGDPRGGFSGHRGVSNAMGDDAEDLQRDAEATGACLNAFAPKSCALTVIKGYAEGMAHGYARAGSAMANGCTPDLAALTSSCDRLLAEDAGRRVLILVTDGEGDSAVLMGQAVRRYTARGVVIVAVGIGQLPTCEGYQYRAEVADVKDLGGAALRGLLATVLNDNAARAEAA